MRERERDGQTEIDIFQVCVYVYESEQKSHEENYLISVKKFPFFFSLWKPGGIVGITLAYATSSDFKSVSQVLKELP